MRKVLFVCSRNRLRSPTAEQMYASREDLQVASAGLAPDAEERVSAELVAWADLIFVMEKQHLKRLRSRFAAQLRAPKRVVCLDISDDYDFMQPELMSLLQAKLAQHLNHAS